MKRSRCRYRTSIAAALSVLLVVLPIDAATLTVTSAADTGGTCFPGATCTLRQAISTSLPGDTITFAAGITTISLTSELLITNTLTINGPGANLLTVKRSTADGTPQFRVFAIQGSSNVTISGLTISNGSVNLASDDGGGGGGILAGGTSLTITGCIISGNFADQAGGSVLNGGGMVSIINSTISGNSTTYSGGIDNAFGGRMTVTDSTISGNSATFGGGILNDLGCTLTITNSTISSNSASGNGGGIFNESGAAVTIINSTLVDNTANGGDGGGFYNVASYAGAGEVTITNSTIFGNSADRGGGIFQDVSAAGFISKNTIIARNTAPSGGADFYGALVSLGFNLIGDNSGATIFPAPSTDQVGTSAFPIDPMLGPLQDNGGPTQTLALLSSSTAIDTGNSSGSTTDQRGFPRPTGSINVAGGDGSDIGAFEVQTPAPPALGNLSTRMRVETGDNVLIGGFIVTGAQPKKVIVRAIGPSLPLAGKLADPTLELFGPGGFISSNDNWVDALNKQEIIDALPPSDDLESAILTTLDPAAYTAIVRGSNNGTGVGLVELYDLGGLADSKLANISSRGLVQTGDNVIIGGFIVTGTGMQRVIVRALGPSVFPTGNLADPTLELVNQDGTLVGSNNDWRSDQETEIIATSLPPGNDLEAAIVITLPPGGTTAIVRGKNGTTGVALVEVYALNLATE